MLYTAVLQTKPINNCNVDTKNIEEMKVATESKYINPQLGDILIQVDEESKRRRSPYYGLKYKHTYGLPLSHFNLRSFRNNLTDWKHFFPELTNALNSFAKINPSHDELAFTSPNTTVIVIEGNRSRYMTGDTFKATIYAKDRLGRPKEFGGDFFRARLLRNTGFVIIPDGIPCVIIDHWNGSYSITAPLVQAAVFTLEVVLVSSLEAISRLIQFTATNREIGQVYLAELESGEKVHCNVDMSAYPIYRNTETCDYSNPRNQEPWFCIKPPSGVCSRIINIVFSEMPDEEPIHNFAATLKSKYVSGKQSGLLLRRLYHPNVQYFVG
uniref:Uncharacterized protein n=1 Tax=Ciona savignyi TaxID=51511 RepID=H2ZEU4_CIOSA